MDANTLLPVIAGGLAGLVTAALVVTGAAERGVDVLRDWADRGALVFVVWSGRALDRAAFAVLAYAARRADAAPERGTPLTPAATPERGGGPIAAPSHGR